MRLNLLRLHSVIPVFSVLFLGACMDNTGQTEISRSSLPDFRGESTISLGDFTVASWVKQDIRVAGHLIQQPGDTTIKLAELVRRTLAKELKLMNVMVVSNAQCQLSGHVKTAEQTDTNSSNSPFVMELQMELFVNDKRMLRINSGLTDPRASSADDPDNAKSIIGMTRFILRKAVKPTPVNHNDRRRLTLAKRLRENCRTPASG